MCGVVWCGVVWCGVVWCGVVWCGVVWCGTGHKELKPRHSGGHGGDRDVSTHPQPLLPLECYPRS